VDDDLPEEERDDGEEEEENEEENEEEKEDGEGEEDDEEEEEEGDEDSDSEENGDTDDDDDDDDEEENKELDDDEDEDEDDEYDTGLPPKKTTLRKQAKGLEDFLCVCGVSVLDSQPHCLLAEIQASITCAQLTGFVYDQAMRGHKDPERVHPESVCPFSLCWESPGQ